MISSFLLSLPLIPQLKESKNKSDFYCLFRSCSTAFICLLSVLKHAPISPSYYKGTHLRDREETKKNNSESLLNSK